VWQVHGITRIFIVSTLSFIKQAAQLWQRDRAMLHAFSINVQRYSQNQDHASVAAARGKNVEK